MFGCSDCHIHRSSRNSGIQIKPFALFLFRCCWLAQCPWVLEQLGVSSTPTTCPFRSHSSSSSSNSSCNSSSNSSSNTASSAFRRNSCLLRYRFLPINYKSVCCCSVEVQKFFFMKKDPLLHDTRMSESRRCLFLLRIFQGL